MAERDAAPADVPRKHVPGGSGSPSVPTKRVCPSVGWWVTEEAAANAAVIPRWISPPIRRRKLRSREHQKSPRWSAGGRARLARRAPHSKGAESKVRRPALRPPGWSGGSERRNGRSRRPKKSGRGALAEDDGGEGLRSGGGCHRGARARRANPEIRSKDRPAWPLNTSAPSSCRSSGPCRKSRSSGRGRRCGSAGRFRRRTCRAPTPRRSPCRCAARGP